MNRIEPMIALASSTISPSLLQAIDFDYPSISSKLDYDKILEELMKRINIVPTKKYQCNSCGGVLELKHDEHIFKCPYCRTAYAIGTTQINARY